MARGFVSPFVAGLLFGAGLIVSRMYDPAKVKSFLDISGVWDPSLALVMAGAIAVALPAFQLARRRTSSLSGGPVELPRSKPVDRPLIVGAAIFGVGWGLVGLCPGPAILDLALDWRAWAFVASMAAGMAIHSSLCAPRVSLGAAFDQDG